MDEPTDLPEGTEVELVAVDPLEAALASAPGSDEPISSDEAAELRAVATSPFTPHDVLRAKLAARRS